MDPCCPKHVWKPTMRISILVNDPADWCAAVIPSPPKRLPLDYCAMCGVLRLTPTPGLADFLEGGPDSGAAT